MSLNGNLAQELSGKLIAHLGGPLLLVGFKVYWVIKLVEDAKDFRRIFGEGLVLKNLSFSKTPQSEHLVDMLTQPQQIIPFNGGVDGQ